MRRKLDEVAAAAIVLATATGAGALQTFTPEKCDSAPKYHCTKYLYDIDGDYTKILEAWYRGGRDGGADYWYMSAVTYYHGVAGQPWYKYYDVVATGGWDNQWQVYRDPGQPSCYNGFYFLSRCDNIAMAPYASLNQPGDNYYPSGWNMTHTWVAFHEVANGQSYYWSDSFDTYQF